MIQEIRTHKIAYADLALALIGFVLSFLHAWPDRMKQRAVVIIMSIFYFLWGVVVHKASNHINGKVIFEYFAMSVLAASLLLLLLK